jgi:four helix bundle protein
MNNDRKFLELEDIRAYKIAFEISNFVWDIVRDWKYFEKNTVGSQLVRAVDSISANIAEGYGRYGKREKIHFYRISFGSLRESIDWVNKSNKRKLISDDSYKIIMDAFSKLLREIRYLIRYTDEKLSC